MSRLQTPTPQISRNEVLLELQLYGFDVGHSTVAQLDETQLSQILEAIRRLGLNLSKLSTTCLSSENELTGQEIFTQVFDTPLQLRYDQNAEFSSVDIVSEDGKQIINIAPSAFVGSSGNKYSQDIINEIIIHEFGHAFHNELFFAQSPESKQGEAVITIPGRSIDPEDNIHTDLTFRIPRGSMPQVVLDYIVATGHYFSGTVDYGDQREQGAYTRQDLLQQNQGERSILPLTNYRRLNLGLPVNCEDTDPECDNNSEYLVNRDGDCIKNGNQCISVNEAYNRDDSRFVYVRVANVYFPTYSNELLNNAEYANVYQLFSNERGDTTEASAPKEGFADTFSVIVNYGYDALPENEPRRQFFEQDDQFCNWIKQLIEAE